MDISLITSLYRGEAHLPAYGRHVERALASLHSMGLSADVLVIANEPTPHERTLLARLPVRVIETPRESLYASWNRGIATMQTDVFGLWNVDDVREGAAIVDAYTLIQQGATLVDAPMRVEKTIPFGPFTRHEHFVRPAFLHQTDAFTRKHAFNPFGLIHRRLIDEIGLFDADFRVAGDLEWSGRAQHVAQIAVLSQPGGTFHLHGGNLSSTGSARQMIEENIIFLRRQQWNEVRPTPDPETMYTMWETWGNRDHIDVPSEVASRLWGEQARHAWQTWQHEHQQRQRRLKWRRRARAVTDRLGLTPYLKRWQR